MTTNARFISLEDQEKMKILFKKLKPLGFKVESMSTLLIEELIICFDIGKIVPADIPMECDKDSIEEIEKLTPEALSKVINQ